MKKLLPRGYKQLKIGEKIDINNIFLIIDGNIQKKAILDFFGIGCRLIVRLDIRKKS